MEKSGVEEVRGGYAQVKKKKSELAKAAKTYKARTGVGCDGFQPKVPLD